MTEQYVTPIQQRLRGYGTADSRWARLGPYYAMFPVAFAAKVIGDWSNSDDVVLDPFCGRGTAPYIAMIMGRKAIGCDINPVAWLYAKSKISPHPKPEDVNRRLVEIREATTTSDAKPRNEFQALAFGKKALSFIHAARRELRWRDNQLDRTTAAILLHSLHDKLGDGLSNQLRHSRALSPGYCIRWWKNHGLGTPPDVDPVELLGKKVSWRYGKGIPSNSGSAQVVALFGDAASTLPAVPHSADLVLTSPPYGGVTNYRSDSWLRLWALGEGPTLPDWKSAEKFCNPEKYATMLRRVLGATHDKAKPEAIWYIRIDARPRTKNIIEEIMGSLLPNHKQTIKLAPYPNKTQTALYGDHRPKPGEIDLIYQPSDAKSKVA